MVNNSAKKLYTNNKNQKTYLTFGIASQDKIKIMDKDRYYMNGVKFIGVAKHSETKELIPVFSERSKVDGFSVDVYHYVCNTEYGNLILYMSDEGEWWLRPTSGEAGFFNKFTLVENQSESDIDTFIVDATDLKL